MRKADAAADVDVIAPADAPHDAAEVAESVDRDDGCFVERGSEERTGQMRAMVLDEVNLHAVGMADAGRAEPAGEPRDVHGVLRA